MGSGTQVIQAHVTQATQAKDAYAIWITGLPGCGKTTIAEKVHESLCDLQGRSVKHLQLDKIRKIITPHPNYTDEERTIVYASLAYMAHLLVESGVSVIIDATANQRRYRDLARSLIPRFVEVYVKCPLDVCVERECIRHAEYAPTGIYASAGGGGTVPGVDVKYEAPLHPEIVVQSDLTDATACADAIVRYVLEM